MGVGGREGRARLGTSLFTPVGERGVSSCPATSGADFESEGAKVGEGGVAGVWGFNAGDAGVAGSGGSAWDAGARDAAGECACAWEGNGGKGGRERCTLGDVLSSRLWRAATSISGFTSYLGCAGLKLPVCLDDFGDLLNSLDEFLLTVNSLDEFLLIGVFCIDQIVINECILGREKL